MKYNMITKLYKWCILSASDHILFPDIRLSINEGYHFIIKYDSTTVHL